MNRGRPKQFCKEDVLNKALPVFWEKGFASTSLQQLEQATGVNKSGLYAEFQSKDDLYVACLDHYLNTRGAAQLLFATPLGWPNIERFLKFSDTTHCTQQGCFTVNATKDIANIPDEAHQMLQACFKGLNTAILQNVQAENTTMDAALVAKMIQIYFFGLSVESNIDPELTSTECKVDDFMYALRLL